VTYSITGLTADGGLFSITAGGVLTFNTAPDFETPADIGGNNVYNIEVTADDGNGGVTVQNISVSVTNSNELPVITSSAAPSILENTTAVTTVTATDVDAGDMATFTITGGVDAGLFSINNISGSLTFNTAPNFENPADNGVNNIYNLQVTADDGNGGLTVQNISVSVADTNEAPAITSQTFQTSADSSNGTVIGQVISNDIDNGDISSYSITTGTGVGLFAINSSTGEISIANGNSLLSGGSQIYTLEIRVTDSTGATSQATITINVLPAVLTTETIIDAPKPTPPEPNRTDIIENEEESSDGYTFLGSRPQVATTTPTESVPHNIEPHPELPKVSAILPSTGTIERIESTLLSIRTEYLNHRVSGALSNALDNMRDDINASGDKSNEHTFKTTIQGTGIILTAGFASWIVRGSSLLASFLSTMPVWRGLDPLPILAAFRDSKDDAEKQDKDSLEKSPTNEVEEYFENENMKTSENTITGDASQGRHSE